MVDVRIVLPTIDVLPSNTNNTTIYLHDLSDIFKQWQQKDVTASETITNQLNAMNDPYQMYRSQIDHGYGTPRNFHYIAGDETYTIKNVLSHQYAPQYMEYFETNYLKQYVSNCDTLVISDCDNDGICNIDESLVLKVFKLVDWNKLKIINVNATFHAISYIDRYVSKYVFDCVNDDVTSNNECNNTKSVQISSSTLDIDLAIFHSIPSECIIETNKNHIFNEGQYGLNYRKLFENLQNVGCSEREVQHYCKYMIEFNILETTRNTYDLRTSRLTEMYAVMNHVCQISKQINEYFDNSIEKNIDRYDVSQTIKVIKMPEICINDVSYANKWNNISLDIAKSQILVRILMELYQLWSMTNVDICLSFRVAYSITKLNDKANVHVNCSMIPNWVALIVKILYFIWKRNTLPVNKQNNKENDDKLYFDYFKSSYDKALINKMMKFTRNIQLKLKYDYEYNSNTKQKEKLPSFIKLSIHLNANKLQWEKERLLWIAYDKNQDNPDCFLSMLPKDLLIKICSEYLHTNIEFE